MSFPYSLDLSFGSEAATACGGLSFISFTKKSGSDDEDDFPSVKTFRSQIFNVSNNYTYDPNKESYDYDEGSIKQCRIDIQFPEWDNLSEDVKNDMVQYPIGLETLNKTDQADPTIIKFQSKADMQIGQDGFYIIVYSDKNIENIDLSTFLSSLVECNTFLYKKNLVSGSVEDNPVWEYEALTPIIIKPCIKNESGKFDVNTDPTYVPIFNEDYTYWNCEELVKIIYTYKTGNFTVSKNEDIMTVFYKLGLAEQDNTELLELLPTSELCLMKPSEVMFLHLNPDADPEGSIYDRADYTARFESKGSYESMPIESVSAVMNESTYMSVGKIGILLFDASTGKPVDSSYSVQLSLDDPDQEMLELPLVKI